jgi:hypothetical protein
MIYQIKMIKKIKKKNIYSVDDVGESQSIFV